MVLLGVLAVWLVRYPRVQTWLVLQSQAMIGNALDAEIEIGRVDLALPISAELRGVKISTLEGALIGEVNSLKISLLNFGLWKYLLNDQPSHTLHIEAVSIDGLRLPVYRNSQGNLNLTEWLGPSNPNSKPLKRPIHLDIDDLRISNSFVSYVDSLRLPPDSLRGEMLHATEMYFDSISVVTSFSLGPGRRFVGDITHLSVIESLSGLALEDLSMKVVADTTHERDPRGWREVVPFVDLRGLTFREGLTFLQVDFHFPHTELMEVLEGDLLHRYLEADWTNSQLHSSTIEKFLVTSLPFEGMISFDGTTQGTLDDLYSPGITFRIGQKTSLQTRFRINNLLDYDRTDLDLIIEESQVGMSDLRAFLRDGGLPPTLDSVVLRSLRGSFQGHYKDFQVAFRTKSSAGTLAGDIHLTLPPRAQEFTYQGLLQAEGLNPNALGFRQVLDSRQLNLSAKLDGHGLDIRTLTTDLDLEMWNSDLWGREVDSLHAVVDIVNQRIVGTASGLDKGAEVDLTVDLDYGKSPAAYVVQGRVFNLDLQRYGLWDESIRLSTRLSADFEGDSLEQIAGKVVLGEFSLIRPDLDPFNLYRAALDVSRNREGEKVFELASPLANANLRGNFSLKQVGNLVTMLAAESQLYFSNNDSLINDYYAQKTVDTLAMVEGSLLVISQPELNPLLEFMEIPLVLADSAQMSVEFFFGMYENVKLLFASKWVTYGDIRADQVSSEIEVYKAASDNQMGLLAGLSIDRLNLAEDRYLERISFEVDGIDDRFNSTLRVRQEEQNSLLTVLGTTYFLPNGSIRTEFDSDRSLLVFNSDSLILMPDNAIILNKGVIDIRNLLLQSEATYFRLDGLISQNPQDALTLSVGQFPLSLLSDFTTISYAPEGMFNLEVKMQQFYNDPCISMVSRIDQFELDEFPYGDIFTQAHWQSSSNQLQLDASLWDGQDTTLHLLGYYDLADSVAPIHLNLTTENSFPFDYLYPFVKAQLYELQGKVDLDQFSITGSASKPVIRGTGHFTDAGFGIEYFKTKYVFDGSITFDNDRIQFPRIRLYDQHRNYAQLYGFIYHQGFSDFRFDLQLEEVRNFLLMNTKKGDNELFYGRLVLKDGLGSVTGDLEKLKLDVFATSGRGSFLKIPLEDESIEGRPDFIHFSGESREETAYSTGLQDFEINLNMALTPDLEVDLIFDERVGDIIRGKGVGNLSMFINEAGEFTMFGDYEITEGNYLFTAQNILNKKFLVKPGGNIVWSGDPYDAQVNLEAYYPLSADISQLLQEEQSIRTPVNVNMGMSGSLMSPALALSIELPNLTEGDASQIASYLKSIQYDEQELNKQVFSLMVFNRFAPVGGFFGADAASTGVTTSVSEMISNQLNYWLGQAVGDNLNVGVGTNNFQDVNLLLSASLFNDRVVIERDGTLIDDRAHLTIGNVSVQIKLLPPPGQPRVTASRPSELVLEVFTRESLDAQANSNTNQTGLGIFYKKDFDRVGELFQRKRKKSR